MSWLKGGRPGADESDNDSSIPLLSIHSNSAPNASSNDSLDDSRKPDHASSSLGNKDSFDVDDGLATQHGLESHPLYRNDSPTEKEKVTLLRVSGPLPYEAFLIALLELAERFSYYGSTVVLNFIQQPLPRGSRTGAGGSNGQSGALGKGQQASTGIGTFNMFWVYCTPLLGAYLADEYWGRYKTLVVACGIATIGHILLTISALPSILVDPDRALTIFLLAIIVMGIGTGAFKSNVSPLIAEQIKDQRLVVKVRKDGTRVIQDPALTASRLYMAFYFCVNVGALIGQITMVYAEKYYGFYLAFLLPTIVFLLCPIVLFIGRNRYQRTPPSGSVLNRALNIFLFAAKQRDWSFSKMRRKGFWDEAKPSRIERGLRPLWMDSSITDEWVEEVKRGFKACKVFGFLPIYWLAYNQINTNLTSQAALLNTHGLPNDILSNLDPLALLILIPICDIFIYPALRRAKIKFGPMRRVTLGFFTGSLAMCGAAFVQQKIYKLSPCGDKAASCEPIDLSVWIQAPSYILIALSEILASITCLEYSFTKAPRNMRSLITSVFLFTSAISAAIGEVFLPVSKDPYLVWNYGSLALLTFIAGGGFWFSFRHLDDEDERLNDLSGDGTGFDQGRSGVGDERFSSSNDHLEL